MNICFECGGKVKLITKAGRLVWDEEELFEIPTEFKIPTCLECGHCHEDVFVQTRLNKSIVGQKKIKPGFKLLMLRWIDYRLEDMFDKPSSYGKALDILSQIKLLLTMREMVLSKGESDKKNIISNRIFSFLHKKWPKTKESIENINLLDIDTEFSASMKEFCDVWIFAE